MAPSARCIETAGGVRGKNNLSFVLKGGEPSGASILKLQECRACLSVRGSSSFFCLKINCPATTKEKKKEKIIQKTTHSCQSERKEATGSSYSLFVEKGRRGYSNASNRATASKGGQCVLARNP